MRKIMYFLPVLAVLVLIGAGCGQGNSVLLNLEVPRDIEAGSEFQFQVSVENVGNKQLLLHSIDIGDPFLDGVEVLETKPAYSEIVNLGLLNQKSFTLEIDLPAGETTEVAFKALAPEAGLYTGDFDVCFGNAGGRCEEITIAAMVSESLEEAPAEDGEEGESDDEVEENSEEDEVEDKEAE